MGKQRRERAIGYVRVSTVEQVSGFGLQVQEGAIRRWARDHEHRLVAVVRDEGVSGSDGLDSRPGLASALAMLEAGEGDVLLVYRLDRLARDLIIQETAIERIQSKGCMVISVTEPDVAGQDPTRVLVRQVIGALSQYERAVITARMAAGRKAKAAAGGYAGGRPPYGSSARAGSLERLPEEQATITLARRLHRRGLSLRAVAAHLEEAGHPPRMGGQWHPTQISRLLTSKRLHKT